MTFYISVRLSTFDDGYFLVHQTFALFLVRISSGVVGHGFSGLSAAVSVRNVHFRLVGPRTMTRRGPGPSCLPALTHASFVNP